MLICVETDLFKMETQKNSFEKRIWNAWLIHQCTHNLGVGTLALFMLSLKEKKKKEKKKKKKKKSIS